MQRVEVGGLSRFQLDTVNLLPRGVTAGDPPALPEVLTGLL